MSDTVIKVENLSKQYRLGNVGTGTIAHDLNRWWQTMRGREDPYLKIGEENDRSVKGNSEYVWALKDINFEVKQGEVLGIIGRNGAGKSTLLKILSRTTTPTTGSVKIKGRIASLLEVGTGFHPELTGRENIFLNGAILGMTKAEIKKKFDEIVDFAGVERYIDTPVKRYSSGMYVRLAFGVAAHLEPEILIVDEVLAVGDAEFQKKALGKMKDVSGKDGRTVLFVSHNMAAVQKICDTGLILKNGGILKNEKISNIISEYLKIESFANCHYYQGKGDVYQATISSEENCFKYKRQFNIEVRFKTKVPIKNLVLGIVVKDMYESYYLGFNNKHYLRHKLNEQNVSEGVIRVSIQEIRLLPGKYKIDLFLGDSTVDIQVIEDAFLFNIEESTINNTSHFLDYRMNKIFIDDIKWTFNPVT
jgi:lipopolysaccharide transport system ATP-binding protein